MACCSKAKSVLPKLQLFGYQEHTDALLLFATILDIPIENQPHYKILLLPSNLAPPRRPARQGPAQRGAAHPAAVRRLL